MVVSACGLPVARRIAMTVLAAMVAMTVALPALFSGWRFGRRLIRLVFGVLVCHEGMLGSGWYERCHADSGTNIAQTGRVCNVRTAKSALPSGVSVRCGPPGVRRVNAGVAS